MFNCQLKFIFAFKNKKTQSGQIILNVLVVIAILTIISSYVAQNGVALNKLSKSSKYKSAQMIAESKVRAAMMSGEVLENCDANNFCDLNNAFFVNIDSTKLIKAVNLTWNKMTGDFSVALAPTDPDVILKTKVIEMQLKVGGGRTTSAWFCPDDKPVFRGYDLNGQPRCEPIYINYAEKCKPDEYITGLEVENFEVNCQSIVENQWTDCSQNTASGELLLKKFTWNGQNMDKSCEKQQDPFQFFSFSPTIKRKPSSFQPDVIENITPIPSPSTEEVSPMPASAPIACTQWGPLLAMEGDCSSMAPQRTGADSFECQNPADINKTIFQCQRCIAGATPDTYRKVALRVCKFDSKWEDISGATAEADHFCCAGKAAGDYVEDGDSLCCLGQNSVHKIYQCQDSGGRLVLKDPLPSSAEFIKNINFKSAANYQTTRCR